MEWNSLVHYDPQKFFILSVDASPYGIGAVLSHLMENGSKRPVEFASRTLSSVERNYAKIEKEGLAIIFGIKRFQFYLYGRTFTLLTDHQPLTRIFGPKSSVPPLTAARLQRWAVLLSGYDFDIIFKKSPSWVLLDPITMTVYPTSEKIEKIIYTCQGLLECPHPNVREVASTLGLLVSNFPAAKLGPLHFRPLDMDKTEALRLNRGKFDAFMQLSELCRNDLQ